MRVKIASIADRADLDKERIVMKVLSDTDIGSYAVFNAEVQNGVVTTGVQDVFWFPDKKVSEGDFVVLYTKRGKQSEKKLHVGGKMTHFFYWGSSTPKWKTGGTAPVLLFISEWEAFTE
jgi:hypothetical protein